MYMLAVEVGSRYSPIKALAIAIRTIAIAAKKLLNIAICNNWPLKKLLQFAINAINAIIQIFFLKKVYLICVFQQVLKSISPDYWVRTWEKVPWQAILNICLCCELSQNYAVFWFHLVKKIQMFGIPKKLLHFHYCTFSPNSIAIMQ